MTKIKKQCRLCLKQKDDTSNIFKKTKSGEIISVMIMSLTKLQIYPGDGLPNLVCRNCVRRVHSCIQFVQICENSDEELRKSLLMSKGVGTKGQSDTKFSCDDDEYELNKILNQSTKNDDETSIHSEYLDLNSSDNDDDQLQLDLNDDDNISINSEINIDSSESSEEILSAPKESDVKSPYNRNTLKAQCSKCGKIVSTKYMKNHLAFHAGIKSHSCKFCHKKFVIRESLTMHLRTHTGEKPYICPVCEESFAHYSSFYIHKRRHTGQAPYKCSLCPRRFRSIASFQYHKRTHTGERNFACDKCGATFITKQALQQHVLTHRGERLHVCTICGLRYTRLANLKRHIYDKHRDGKKNLTQKELDLIKRKKERKVRNAVILD